MTEVLESSETLESINKYPTASHPGKPKSCYVTSSQEFGRFATTKDVGLSPDYVHRTLNSLIKIMKEFLFIYCIKVRVWHDSYVWIIYAVIVKMYLDLRTHLQLPFSTSSFKLFTFLFLQLFAQMFLFTVLQNYIQFLTKQHGYQTQAFPQSFHLYIYCCSSSMLLCNALYDDFVSI